MVVVNDALHMVGREDVVVEVLSTRRTAQGLLVFASLADRGGDPASRESTTASGTTGSDTYAESRGQANGSGAQEAYAGDWD
jgi:hypothetical protein